jgi:hypothetical protein
MGEAKRRKAILTEAPCICGSLKPARECRFDGLNWHKAPSALGLKSLPRASIVEKCYMKELGSCDGGISGEHLISESIILLLAADGDFTISGLPWIPPGECEIVPKRGPSGKRTYVFECTCESVFGNRVAFRAKLDPRKFAILIVKSIRWTISWEGSDFRAYLHSCRLCRRVKHVLDYSCSSHPRPHEPSWWRCHA